MNPSLSRMHLPAPATPSTNRAHSAFGVLSQCFAAALEAACGAPAAQFGQRIRTALNDAAVLAAHLPAEVLDGSETGYSRHVLAMDPAGRFAAAALVWRPGQHTAVHAHQTWCGYRVVKGVLSEDYFRWDKEAAQACLAETRQRGAGESSFVAAGFEGIHRLGNRSPHTAISFHVYGVHADDIATRVNRLVDTAAPLDMA
jgi:predicted metal-dependent enzyme (double-stranded beta helix superfamily)